jgi:hypothetical protein
MLNYVALLEMDRNYVTHDSCHRPIAARASRRERLRDDAMDAYNNPTCIGK